jgi:mxaA protein
MTLAIRRQLLNACAVVALGFSAVCVGQELPGSPPVPDTPAGPAPNAIVEQPRSFGYVVGDLIRQRVLLQVEGQAFEPAVLPHIERAGVWLERRAPWIESGDDGRRWLIVEYQLINAPQALAMVELPAWELQSKSGKTPLRIGAWPVSVTALTPRAAFAKGDLGDLRPDRPAPIIAIEPLRRRLAFTCAAFALTLVLWAGWWRWREWRASSMQPFACALREMRRVGDSAPQSWHALHRAIDRTAGQAIQSATLPDLFLRAPHLVPLRAKIEQFFDESGARFFAGTAGRSLPLRELCSELRRLEKRHEQ